MLVFVSAGLFDATGQVGANREEIPIRPLDLTGREHSSDLRPLLPIGRHTVAHGAVSLVFPRTHRPVIISSDPAGLLRRNQYKSTERRIFDFWPFEFRDGMIMGGRFGKMIAATPRFGE